MRPGHKAPWSGMALRSLEDGCRPFDAGSGGGRLQHHDPHHSQSAQADRLPGHRRRGRRLGRPRAHAREALWPGHLGLEHGADDGYELLKEVRADPGLSKTPFIMVTAESKTENVIAAKKAGVNNYIVKPFNAQTLQSKIEAVFPE